MRRPPVLLRNHPRAGPSNGELHYRTDAEAQGGMQNSEREETGMHSFIVLLNAICVATALFASSAAEAAGEALPPGVDPATGFRMERYRAPTPETMPGGRVVQTVDVQGAMADGRTILVDVYPPKGAGPDPLDGTWRNSETRDTIPGAIWLPEVGRGFLAADYEAYFRRNLDALTAGDRDRPLLFFCTADCWQGWNAARRAILWGHTSVSWYPGGTDQWRLDDGPIERAEPVNFLEEPR